MVDTKFIFDKQSGTLKPKSSDELKKTAPNSHNKEPQYNTEVSENQEGIYKFRAISDLTSFQIMDEQTRKPMAVISGYGLSFKFNMSELRSTEKVEQFLNGLSAMFRKLIIEQSLGNGGTK